ncbi:MAG: glycosyltransferase family 4 protein [bacterium]
MINHKKRVLLLNMCDGFGGMAVHNIGQYQALLGSRDYDVTLLIPEKSKIRQKLDALGLSYLTTNVYPYFKLPVISWLAHIKFFFYLYGMVKEKNIQIIHSNLSRELWACKMVARFLPVKVVHTRHTAVTSCGRYRWLGGVIGVSSFLVEALGKCGLKNVAMILPFFDERKFLDFVPKSGQTRQDFFKTKYNIAIKNVPIICTIACFNTNKNHVLLVRALHKLVYEKNKPVQLILVGQGRRKKILEKFVCDLKLQDYVYYVGFTDDTPAILYNSDMHALPSKREALGIVSLEAMLMGKPVICADKTGAQTIIIHEKTGLLFENNNGDDLVEKIEYLLDNQARAKELGENAYAYVCNNFLQDTKLAQLEQFYTKIFGNSVCKK